MPKPPSFVMNPTQAEVAAWQDANSHVRPLSQLEEIGIDLTAVGMFKVGAYRFNTLPEAVVQARQEQTRSKAREADLLLNHAQWHHPA
jgi:hypothetical protein